MQACPAGNLQTNTPGQPLWKLRGSFLPAAAFTQLRRELLETRPLLQPHHFSDGFNAVNIDFNREGAGLYIILLAFNAVSARGKVRRLGLCLSLLGNLRKVPATCVLSFCNISPIHNQHLYELQAGRILSERGN